MRSNKDLGPPKKKSLSIHIDTGLIGPHGMPLVYGSTEDKIGSIKGTVRFSSNYDCKGRDIQIIYEAWVESKWTVTKSKKTVHRHRKEVFGYQTWSFPLIHTKHNGSTVIAGSYEKDFEVLLTHPSDRARRSFDSNNTTTTTLSTLSTLSLSDTEPSLKSSSATSLASTLNEQVNLLPSSCNSPHSKIKYTLRAVLQRPFPSLSNVEASQEIWVINSAQPCVAPSFSPSSSHSNLPFDIQTFDSSISIAESTSTTSACSSPRSHVLFTVDSGESTATHKTSLALVNPVPVAVPKPKNLTAMPPTPYGGKQLVMFLYCFCTFVLGLGFYKRCLPQIVNER
ncbi:hypothetical protein BG011_002061 [Mortierella polycephala]|uniref:Uncharacterized protein n=1 Tax=Mortierella polycephala TaxID=41804 RepID=A0A9P6Q5B2_9FUNG|nr:hypothetical protein BG011_002061 [Mortierella polycephala]